MRRGMPELHWPRTNQHLFRWLIASPPCWTPAGISRPRWKNKSSMKRPPPPRRQLLRAEAVNVLRIQSTEDPLAWSVLVGSDLDHFDERTLRRAIHRGRAVTLVGEDPNRQAPPNALALAPPYSARQSSREALLPRVSICITAACETCLGLTKNASPISSPRWPEPHWRMPKALSSCKS